MDDQYAIIRINKLKDGDLGGVERHNLRIGPPEPNVDPTRSHLNRYIKSGNHGLKNSILTRIKDAGVTRKIRPDAVLGIEVMMTASPEFFDADMREGKSPKLEEWIADSVNYVNELAGGEQNIVQLVLHMDETGSPHLHAVFVPLTDDAPSTSKKKETSAKKKEKTEEKKIALNAKPWTSPGKWQRMWTTYAAAMAKHGLIRGEFRLEDEPMQEHVTLKADRAKVLKIAQQAASTAETAVGIADQALQATKRQDAKIELLVKKQEQVIQEQQTLIQSIRNQLKEAHETIKRLLGVGGTQEQKKSDLTAEQKQNLFGSDDEFTM